MTRRALVALLVVAALGCLVAAWRLPSTDPAPTAPVSTPARGPVAPVLAAAPVPARVAVPLGLGVPAIGIAGARLLRLGLQDDGTVEVPSDPDRAGWFDLGTVPGEVGSAVLLGHVDSTAGPAVFARLADLGRGDQINVRLTGGRLAHFRVRAVRTYSHADFPARKIYTSHGRPTLALVTCGGTYDPARGGYQANVVVYAELA